MASDERLVFAPSVEGLFIRGLGSQLAVEARIELKQVGIDLSRPLRPAYPAEVWHRALAVVAKHVYPLLPPEQAYFKMGERTVYGLEEHLVGKAMVALARLVGPRKTLLRLPNSVKSGSNFAHLTVQELAPNRFHLVSQPYMGYAEFMQGSVQTAIAISGGKNARVEIVAYDLTTERLELDASWE